MKAITPLDTYGLTGLSFSDPPPPQKKQKKNKKALFWGGMFFEIKSRIFVRLP